MSSESWFKVGLSALPVGFTVFGTWGYWHENPLPLLAPNLAFWGVVIEFYLFTHIYVPESRAPFVFAVCVSLLWLVSAITAHNLARFLASKNYSGLLSVLATRDFWYAYICAAVGSSMPLFRFLKHEPKIVAKTDIERAATG
jgi:hypothetical protein